MYLIDFIDFIDSIDSVDSVDVGNVSWLSLWRTFHHRRYKSL